MPSPALFRKWAGIATIAGALERKVWVKTFEVLYPTLYTIIVGPPGVGKSVVTSLTQKFWGDLPDHKLAPNAVSRASLIDALFEAQRKVVVPRAIVPVVTFNSLLVVSNELGVLIPGYDNEFMNTLTDIYDGKKYAEKKRSSKLDIDMKAPQLSLLAATTPSYLHSVMPEGAWDQGFISRVILVYSGEIQLRTLFPKDKFDETPYKELLEDLKVISELYGEIKFTPEAATSIDMWHLKKGPPTPDYPKLVHYNTRRTQHLLKLCMVASVSRANDLIVTLEDFHTALSWLLEAEQYMPDIFRSMALGGDAKALEDCHYYALQVYAKEKEHVSEARLIEFLQNRVPAHSVERVLILMVKSGLLEKKLDGYKPRAKRVQ